jgi:mRNA interferase RelE/StbE
MEPILERKAAKYLERLNEPMKSKLKKALENLGKEPPSGDIIPLQGRDGYRLRVGSFRILFDKTDMGITVYKIAPRGQSYKEN